MHVEAGNRLVVASSIRHGDGNILAAEGMVNLSAVIVQDCDLLESNLCGSFAIFSFPYADHLTGCRSSCVLFYHRARIPLRNQLAAFKQIALRAKALNRSHI